MADIRGHRADKGDQLALYDNGVGTSSFKPLAMLGGGTPAGASSATSAPLHVPVHQLRPGDRIFAFGFSRGAFTIRVLIGLVADQGLITGAKDRELEAPRQVGLPCLPAEFNPTKGLVTPLRAIRDWMLRKFEQGPPYTGAGSVRPRVAFAGLWDTVDAYGLPIDEMTRGWDKYVWPLR